MTIPILGIFSIGPIIGYVVSFIIGALVFRNNKTAGEKVVQEAKDKYNNL